jgi:hypothetical protein
MRTQLLTNRGALFFRAVVLATLAAVVAVASSRAVRAADLAEQAHSLKQVPANAAFYSASLRLAEQWHTFKESKAYGKLMEIPLVQLGKMQAQFQWQQTNEPTVVRIREYLASPAGQDAVAVLREMFADEVFAYGGDDIGKALKVLMEMSSIERSARAEAKAEGEDSKEAVKKKVFEKLLAKLEDVSVPTFVTGFRIKDKERAERELNEIHSLLRNALDEHRPELAAHLQREQIGKHEFLTLRVDGSMIPWDKIREKAEDLDEEEFNKIRDLATKKTIAVAIGVVDEFVLVSIGPSTAHLETIGQGSSIADQPAIKRLEKHAGERLVSLGYMSKAFAQGLNSPEKTMNDILSGVEEGLTGAEVDEEDRKVILDDIRAIDLKKYMPEAGDIAGVAYLTDRGYEAYQYVSAKRPMMDSSKPLAILGHVGGSPMLVVASHSKQNIESYNDLVNWIRKIAVDAERIAEKKADEDDWKKYMEYRDRFVNLLERLDKATREQMFPALAGGECAVVMDVTAKSKQWFDKMPESPKPLPMLELAFVTSVSDAAKLEQGVSAYIHVAHDAYKLVQEIHPDDAPKVKIPKPVITEPEGAGKLYSFPLPKKWGINSVVAVNAGLTDKYAAVSLMPETTERLLKEQKPGIDTSLPLDKPAAMVSHIEFAKILDAIRPWMNYGLDVAMGNLKPKKDENDSNDEESDDTPKPPSGAMMQLGFVVPQIQQFLDVAAALKSATSMTYEEDGVWVTHSETHIVDLK